MRKVKTIDFAQQKTLLKIQRFSRELREQPVYRKQLFSGAKSKISFPASLDYFPSRLTYYFDRSSSCFMRQADKLDQIIAPDGKVDAELKSKPAVFLSKIKEVKFDYLYLDLKKNEYSWAQEWEFNYLPIAVKLTITDENKEYISTVFLLKDL